MLRKIMRTNAWRDRHRILDCFGLFLHDPTRITPTRVYQLWPGKNVFFFRGRIICGPDPRGFLLTTVSILLSEWIFCTYISDMPPKHSVLLFTSSVILTVTAIVSLVLVATRDPGIIPRSDKPPFEEVGTSIGTKVRSMNLGGIEVNMKYCRICKIFRPPRSSHCNVCDNCIEKFDHHCPWIGQCVGLRNYRYYMVFLFSALVFFVYMFSFSWRRIRRKISENDSGLCKALVNIPETLALALFSFAAILFLGGLFIFHVYLISLNQTAHENFKHRYDMSPNPFDKGKLGNIKEALFTNLPPSRLNFRAVIDSWFEPDKVAVTEEDEASSLKLASNQKAESSEGNNEGKHLVEIELEKS